MRGEKLPGPSPREDPEQGHCLPSPIDQPALNVKPHSSHCSARSPSLTPSLAHDLLSGDTTVLMTWFGICTMGLLGLRRWKLWISSWKVTVDDVHSLHISSILLTSFRFQEGWQSKAVSIFLMQFYIHTYIYVCMYVVIFVREGDNVYANCIHMMFFCSRV